MTFLRSSSYNGFHSSVAVLTVETRKSEQKIRISDRQDSYSNILVGAKAMRTFKQHNRAVYVFFERRWVYALYKREGAYFRTINGP